MLSVWQLCQAHATLVDTHYLDALHLPANYCKDVHDPDAFVYFCTFCINMVLKLKGLENGNEGL